MACEECAGLAGHDFRGADDLIHALRTAAEEANRGVLEPIEDRKSQGVAEAEALYSAIDAGAMPGKVLYRFRCTTCGENFTLDADMRTGTGSWTREGARAQ